MNTRVPPEATSAKMRACTAPAGASGTASMASAPARGSRTMTETQGTGYRIARAKMIPRIAAPAIIAKA